MKCALIQLPLLVGSVLSVMASSGETAGRPGAREWIDLLSATYADQGGYLASYESKGENKRLEITVGQDFDSGVFVSRMEATHNGVKMSGRFWGLGDRTLFIDQGGKKARLRIPEMPEALVALLKRLGSEGAEIPKATEVALPSYLTKDTFSVGFVIATKRAPAWVDLLKRAEVLEVTADSVTFAQANYGKIRISRQTGMLIRQEINGADGEARILVLKQFTSHPKVSDLEAIYHDWDAAGAKATSSGQWRKLLLRRALQEIIDAIDPDEAALAKLADALKAGLPDFKAQFAADFEAGEPIRLPDESWRNLFEVEEAKVRAFWDKQEAEHKIPPDLTYRQYLETPGVAAIVAVRCLPNLASRPDLVDKYSEWAVGGPLELPDDENPKARDQVAAMLATAYCSAMVENRMKKLWPPAEEPPAESP